MTFLEELLLNVPLWAWPLFLILLHLGFQSSRRRTIPIYLFFLTPCLGLLSLGSLSELPHPSVAWTGFTIGYLCGMGLAHQMQRRWLLACNGTSIEVQGEWLTMTVLMAVYFANFVVGIAKGVSVAVYSHTAFIGLFTFLVGGASGSFLGRAIQSIRFWKAHKPTQNGTKSL